MKDASLDYWPNALRWGPAYARKRRVSMKAVMRPSFGKYAFSRALSNLQQY